MPYSIDLCIISFSMNSGVTNSTSVTSFPRFFYKLTIFLLFSDQILFLKEALTILNLQINKNSDREGGMKRGN